MTASDACAPNLDGLPVTRPKVAPIAVVSTPRIVGIDAMRAIAVFGVTWIHTVARTPWQRYNVLGRFGAEYFAAAAIFLMLLSASRKGRPSFREFVVSRLFRLIVPFAAWCAIYVALKPFLGWRGISHLWFLPFIFISVVCAWPLSLMLTAPRRAQLLAAGALVVAGALITHEWHPISFELMPRALELPVVHAWSYVPGVLWGGALGLLLHQRLIASRPRLIALFGGVLAVISVAMLFGNGRGMDPLWRNLAGCGCLLLAVGLPNALVVRGLAAVGRSAYGIYLIHPCIGAFALRIGTPAGWQGSLGGAISRCALAIVLSYAATRLLAGWRRMAWLVPAP
jgi:peptidoglycan/LPS O-acetylase OafA/YrhL